MRLPELTSGQRMEVARLSGTMDRLMAIGGPIRVDDGIAVVHGVSRDPLVLGHVLGDYRSNAASWPQYDYTAVIELLRLAGADEERARQVEAWQRWRLNRNAQADGPIL